MTAPSSRIAPSQRHARQPAAGSGRVACLTAAAYLFTAIGLAAEPEPKAAGRKLLSAADETALAGHLKEALEEGYVMGPRSLQEAQKHLALARRLAPGDPRVDFASGLVLLKQSQVRQAIAQFDASARRDGT